MKKIMLVAAAALITLWGDASAALVYFSGILQGTQEVPSNLSPGTGSVLLSVDDTTLSWSLTGNYSNLLGNVTASHIHGNAPVGVNAGVQLSLVHTGGTAGTLSGAGVFLPAQFTALQSELFYVNVHSVVFPGGEVRAQLVPEPTTALLGLASMGLLLRRSRVGPAVS